MLEQHTLQDGQKANCSSERRIRNMASPLLSSDPRSRSPKGPSSARVRVGRASSRSGEVPAGGGFEGPAGGGQTRSLPEVRGPSRVRRSPCGEMQIFGLNNEIYDSEQGSFGHSAEVDPGVQYIRECPLEPHIPIYLLVGGCFGTLKILWLLCQQVRSRRYERIDDAFAEDGLEEIFTSTSYRATDVALTIFLLIWFGMGNYWVYRIYLPNFQNHLYEPNNWCSKTLYLFAVAQLLFVYAIIAFTFLLVICLACGQKCYTLFGDTYK
nr:uncharacterized protein LOC113829928 [Penaeus vannamei]